MTKTQLNKVREAVRTVVNELYAKRRGSTRWLVETVRERHPELIEEAAAQLVSESIAKMARQIMKTEMKAQDSLQTELPLEIAGLQLPAAISVPPDHSEDETLWTPLPDATFRELEGHIAMLQSSVTADTKRLRKLRDLYNYLRNKMPDDDPDQTIRVILEAIKRLERSAA